MNQTSEDIDLIDLFLILWNGKKTLIIFILVSIFIGFAFLFLRDVGPKKSVYQANIEYSVIPIPEFYNTNMMDVLVDFKKNFYLKNIFDDWKDQNLQSPFNFDDITNTKIIDDIIYRKNENELLVSFNQQGHFNEIIIKTDQIIFLDQINKYIDYVNFKITNDYYLKYQELLKMIKKKHQEFHENFPYAETSQLLYRIIEIELLLSNLSDGQKIIDILPPTSPLDISKKGPSKFFIISVLGIFGFLTGSMFLFVRHAVIRRKMKK